MVKLLIADDEPLVCVGIRSMLKWEDYGVEVVGTARNGQQAAKMIASLQPDIVITDIKMPLKTGLELAEECARIYGRIPLFIMFTSYEEFELVHKAIKVQAVDYLVKLDLTPEVLLAAIEKALELLAQYRRQEGADSGAGRGGIQALRDKFFMRLYYNLFDTEEQFLTQMEEAGVDFSSPAYAASICEIIGPENGGMEFDRLLALCNSAMQMVQETLSKVMPCYTTALDMRHFTVTFCLPSGSAGERQAVLEDALAKTVDMVRSYFNVSLRVAVGCVVEDPHHLSESYSSARRLSRRDPAARPGFFGDSFGSLEEGAEFSFSDIRPAIRKAFAELDVASLHEAMTEIITYFESRPDLRVEAMDASCSVLYMAISLLPDGERIMDDIFSRDPDSYRGIYHLQTTDAIVEWLVRFRDGCCGILSSQRRNYKQQVVNQVMNFISENLNKRLSLNEVAAVFNLSPSYLSQLFAKYVGEGFVEYITGMRIAAAKEMLARGEGRIYEVAERLGFENAFYFSKVFKKLEGVSPREYLRKLHGLDAGAADVSPGEEK